MTSRMIYERRVMWSLVALLLIVFAVVVATGTGIGNNMHARLIIRQYRVDGKINPESEALRLVALGSGVRSVLRDNIVDRDRAIVDGVIVEALIRLGDRDLISTMVELLKSSDSKIRETALDSMWIQVAYRQASLFKTQAIIAAVSNMRTNDTSPEVRKSANQFCRNYNKGGRFRIITYS
jgi:hypothetical protein